MCLFGKHGIGVTEDLQWFEGYGSDQSYKRIQVFITGREENELNWRWMEEGAKAVNPQVGNEKGKRMVMGRMESLD